MPLLTLAFKGKRIKDYPLPENRSITIGRRESNDIVIENLGVSANHAIIDGVKNVYTLIDLGSTNGTFVNQELITSRVLEQGDVILIGKHELIFDNSDLDGREAPAEGGTVEKTLHLDTVEYRELIEKARQEAEGKKKG